MGKNTNFIKHIGCEECGSSDANALYSDGSTYCFSCKTTKQAGAVQIKDEDLQFNVIASKLSLEEIQVLPTDKFRGISKDK